MADNKRKMCTKTLVMGAVLGGLAMFAWCMVSWMVLPFHMATLHHFKDDQQVAAVLSQQATEGGVYMVPTCKPETQHQLKKPFAFVALSTQGVKPNMVKSMAIELLTAIACAGLLTFLTMMVAKYAGGFPYWCKVNFIATIGVVVALAAYIPNWNWWHFPLDYTLVGMADILIGTFLSAMVISSVTECKQSDEAS